MPEIPFDAAPHCRISARGGSHRIIKVFTTLDADNVMERYIQAEAETDRVRLRAFSGIQAQTRFVDA
jgi:hypothetical protein